MWSSFEYLGVSMNPAEAAIESVDCGASGRSKLQQIA